LDQHEFRKSTQETKVENACPKNCR